MYDNSVAWIRQNRVNTINIHIDPPAPNTNEAADIVITGIPAGENSNKYKAVIYARTANGLTGPLPTCGTTYDLIQDPNIPSQAQIHIRDWSTGGHQNLVQEATGFRVGLVPAPFTPADEQCLVNAANIPVSAPTIMEAEIARVPPPSASPSSSSSPSPSNSPSSSATSITIASNSGIPVQPSLVPNDIYTGESNSANTNTLMNTWVIVFTFCLGAITMLFSSSLFNHH